ncbi:MAG: zinc ribbon domain-containing protein [Anaerolineales bacterium]|jgi:RNA polymerase subunit RPABC4/transcription elongation factor Spt4|nr:zinc ribbon domain-containing protein [Anaerolineales bacterium]
MTGNLFSMSNWMMILTAWGSAFLVALWVSLVIWTYRDIRSRARDPLLRALAVIVVALLFLPGLVVYWILRPMRTMEEEYQQTLEEEALLQTIEETPLCPGCGRRVKENWLVCPSCQTKLRKNCHHCGKLMELSWNLCPYCGTPAPGMRRENLTLDEALRSLPVEPAKPEEIVQEEAPPEPEEPNE